MIKGIFTYLTILVVSLYLFFMFNENVPGFMLILETLCFCVAVLYSSLVKKELIISLDKSIHISEKNQSIPIWVSVENESAIFPINYKMYFEMINTLTGEKTKFKISGIAEMESSKKITVPITVNNCGNIIITLKKVKVYDLLMFVSRTKKISEHIEVRIVPQLHLFPLEVTRKTRDFIADADEYSDRESGDDPSEVYQIREYSEEDSIHDIHWKLSAKTDTLLVKDKGKPLGNSVLIWINTFEDKRVYRKRKLFIRNKNKNKTASITSDVLEIAASVSLSLFEEKCPHLVAWYEPGNERVKKKKVNKEIHIYELLNYLTLITTCHDEEKQHVMYNEILRRESFSTIVEIRINGEVFVNGEKINIPRNRTNIEWDKLIFTV